MGATAQGDRVGNLTLEEILPKVVDTVNNSNVITARVMAKPKPWNGKAVYQNIHTNNSTQGQFFKSSETFSTAVDMTTQRLVWYGTGFGQPVAISDVEASFNQTEAGVVDLVKDSYEYAQNSMLNRVGSSFYATGSGDEFDGLNLIVDDGTATSSYGGLSRTTYAANINADVNAASGGVLDLDLMDSTDDGASLGGLDTETPNILMTTKSVWSLYGSLLEPTKQAEYRTMGYPKVNSFTPIGEYARGEGLMGRGGFTALDYRGKPMVRDDKCPSGTMYLLNETSMEFRSLKIRGLKTVGVKGDVVEGVYDKEAIRGSAIQFREFMNPVNQLAEVGIFVIYGNLIHRDPRKNGKITGITTV